MIIEKAPLIKRKGILRAKNRLLEHLIGLFMDFWQINGKTRRKTADYGHKDEEILAVENDPKE